MTARPSGGWTLGRARLVSVLAIAVGVFLLDQGTKRWAFGVMEAHGFAPLTLLEAASVEINLVFARNTGVNFGLFASGGALQQWVLAGFAATVSVGLSIWSLRTRDARVAAGCALLIGGALGNALDRTWFGGVFDFLNVDCCGIGNPFAFNVADTAIFFGAVGIAVFARFDDTPRDRQAES